MGGPALPAEPARARWIILSTRPAPSLREKVPRQARPRGARQAPGPPRRTAMTTQRHHQRQQLRPGREPEATVGVQSRVPVGVAAATAERWCPLSALAAGVPRQLHRRQRWPPALGTRKRIATGEAAPVTGMTLAAAGAPPLTVTPVLQPEAQPLTQAGPLTLRREQAASPCRWQRRRQPSGQPGRREPKAVPMLIAAAAAAAAPRAPVGRARP